MKNNFENFSFIDLFAGIGGIRIPFTELGGTCKFTSEWDPYAQKMYEENFSEVPAGDITKINEKDIPQHDILLAGFPCQAFSIMGDKKGFQDTRGTLFFDIERILSNKSPYAFLLENVKNLKSHDQGKTFKTIIQRLRRLGYHVHSTVLNALDFGVPQKRERTFIVGFKENIEFSFPAGSTPPKPLDEILENEADIDSALFASKKIQLSRLRKVRTQPDAPSIWHENKSGNISALPYSCALRAGASYNYLLVNGKRRLSARELLRLQGFPEDFKIVVSQAQIRKQTGNSVAVPVIRAVAKEMLNSMRNKRTKDQTQQLEIFDEQI